MIAGLSQQQPQRAGRLCGERDAAAVETVPDDPHAIGTPCRDIQDVGLADFVPRELKRRIMGMLERMKGVVPQPERWRVGVGEWHEHHGRPAIEQDQHFHEPTVGRVGDEHLRAGQQQSAIVAFQPGADGVEIAAGVGLGRAENRERASVRKARQMPLLLAGRTEFVQCRHRTDRGVHGEHAGGRRRIGGDVCDHAGEFVQGAAGATVGFWHEQSPEAGLSERRLRRG